jgi:hypothetical protein
MNQRARLERLERTGARPTWDEIWLQDHAEPDTYTHPDHGRLTEAQVRARPGRVLRISVEVVQRADQG